MVLETRCNLILEYATFSTQPEYDYLQLKSQKFDSIIKGDA